MALQRGRSVVAAAAVVLSAACVSTNHDHGPAPAAAIVQGADPMSAIADRYVSLVLALGVHDTDYVDAYYGPPELRTQAEAAKLPLADIRASAVSLLADLAATQPPAEEIAGLRHQYLERQIHALVSRIDMLSGTKMTFDEES